MNRHAGPRGRLVAVSNRVGPVKAAAAAGGLAVALVDALRARGGLWLGWSGKALPEVAEPPAVTTVAHGRTSVATLDLSQAQVDAYYSGYSNRCLWPLFHLRPDLLQFERSQLAVYEQVNHRFAAALAQVAEPDDVIWVHDYHLFPLAHELRKLGFAQRIGFFLHIPFPPRDALAVLPNHVQLLRWLCDYDLVGVQSEADLTRLREAMSLAGGTVEGDRLRLGRRSTHARAFPIGIDAEQVRRYADSRDGEREQAKMVEAQQGRALVIGVDRLDYSKGLLRRMDAYERLLARHADARGKVEYLQIAPISRGEVDAYKDFRDQLHLRAAQINGAHGTFDWTPVRCVNRPLARRTLAGLYRAARIGLVTPLRDGMNLVAKEYVAAQDPADPGVLVLSRFAGAAQQMGDALLVNPYDPEEVADAMQKARTMPLEERQRRHAELWRVISTADARSWCDSFLFTLAAAPAAIEA